MKFAATLLALASGIVLAQSTAEVHGRVLTSRDGQPLALVEIHLNNTDFNAVTAADGTFRIGNLAPGAYTLRASAIGYRLHVEEFTLAAGESRNVEIVLTSSAAQRTDTVDVSAGFDLTPEPSASAMTLEGSELKNLASVLADDPLRAVQGMPGVTSNNDFSSGFSLRGAPFESHWALLRRDSTALAVSFH